MQARSPYPSPSRGPAARSVPTEGFTLPARRRPVFRKLKKLGYATLAIVLCALLPFPRWVIEPCNILPIERNELRSRMDGIIARVSVREGQQVSKGDELVRLDDREISAELEKARAEVERLEARLAKLEAGSRPEEIRRSRARVRGLRRELSFAKKEAQRKARLFRDGVTSEEALDAAEQRATVKRHELAKERAELDLLLAGVRPEEIAIARAELRKAEAQVGYLQQLWEDTRIVAPTEGLVITPKIEERENQRVLRGETVVELWQPERVEVEILVPEREIDVVEIGQPATIKVMSHPLQPFQGEVEFIAPAVERVNGESIVRVTVTADNPEQLLREGMSGYGRISTGWTNVLWIFVRRVVRWIRVRFLV